MLPQYFELLSVGERLSGFAFGMQLNRICARFRFLAGTGQGEPCFLTCIKGEWNFVVQPLAGERLDWLGSLNTQQDGRSVDDVSWLRAECPAEWRLSD